MNRYSLILILLVGCTAPAPEPIDFVPAISVAVGVAEATKGATPAPAPTPTKGTCDNCGGSGKVGDGTIFVPCAVCGGDGKIEAVAPAETPLVEKLIPKAEPVRNPYKLVDGQLSPGKQWRWNQSQWAWVPVKAAGPAWVQDGHSATISHLVSEHGYRRSSLEKLTQAQLDVLHSNAHNAARAAAPVRSSGCPGGNCPAPSRGGLFRRR